MRTLADDRTIVIKKAGKRSCVVVWDRSDYIKEADLQIDDSNFYAAVCFKDKLSVELVGTGNKRLKLNEKLVTSNLNILCINWKKLLILLNFIF